MSNQREIHTASAPAALGPYSQAIEAGGFIFTAGQIGIDPQTGQLVDAGIEAETRQVLDNLRQVLQAAGCSFSDVVKTTIFVADLGHFGLVNRIYGEALDENRPARSTVEVAALPMGAAIEIEMIAQISP